MLSYFSVIASILVFVSVIDRSDGKGYCCTGYLRPYDQVEACYWFASGKCCADNAVYNGKHKQLIGSANARIITEEESGFCRHCFSEIIECSESV